MKPYTTKLRCFYFWRPETGSPGEFSHSLPGSCAIKFNMAGNVQFLDLTPSAFLDICHAMPPVNAPNTEELFPGSKCQFRFTKVTSVSSRIYILHFLSNSTKKNRLEFSFFQHCYFFSQLCILLFDFVYCFFNFDLRIFDFDFDFSSNTFFIFLSATERHNIETRVHSMYTARRRCEVRTLVHAALH